MPNWDLRRWGLVSAGLHAAFLAALALFALARVIPEPEEQGISVELVSPGPPMMAQGERIAPVPSPTPDPTPLPPTPEPPAPEPERNRAEAPPPPPPPPPPAPAPTPSPSPAPPNAAAAAPPPAPSPDPVPTPPRQAQQTPTPPRPQQQAAAPPRPEPPLPLPPPPVPPPPEPARTPGTGQTPPVQRPQERSQSVLNTLERLRTTQQQTEAPRARPNPAAGAPRQGGGSPTGTGQLTQGEIRGLADQISECWSVDRGAPEIDRIVVELRVVLDGQGTVRNVVPAGTVPTDPRARAVYESARRALLSPQCNPLRVPADKYQTVMASTFRFNPRGLVR